MSKRFYSLTSEKNKFLGEIDALKVKPHDVLLRPVSQLQTEDRHLSLFQCRKMKRKIAESLHPLVLTSALEMKPHEKLTTGCIALDTFLGGGVPVCSITEISGHSACGKTQFCLQLSLTAQWSKENGGLEAGVLYISTEDRFPSTRLQQFIKLFPDPPLGPKPNYGDNIFIESITNDVRENRDWNELWQCVSKRAPHLMASRAIRLIVVDSVAMVFRTLFDEGAVSRAKKFRDLVKQLTKLAVQYNAAIICVNQVAEVPVEEGQEEDCRVREVPALGLSWANLMHTRLRLSRDQNDTRYLEALSSSEIPSGEKCKYHITSNGLFGI